MSAACACGSQTTYERGWVQCTSPCCPACSVQIESVAYCAGCAAAIVGRDVHSPKSMLI